MGGKQKSFKWGQLLYLDDRNKQFSGTVFRAWLCFYVCMILSVLIGIRSVLVGDLPSDIVGFLTIVLGGSVAGGGFYAVKRNQEK